MYDCMTVHVCIHILLFVQMYTWLSQVEIKHYSIAYFDRITCVRSTQNIRALHLTEFCARAL